MAPADRKPIRVGDTRQWYFTKSVRIPGVDHKVRVLLLWDQRHDARVKEILVTNQTGWEVIQILKVYRYRWPSSDATQSSRQPFSTVSTTLSIFIQYMTGHHGKIYRRPVEVVESGWIRVPELESDLKAHGHTGIGATGNSQDPSLLHAGATPRFD